MAASAFRMVLAEYRKLWIGPDHAQSAAGTAVVATSRHSTFAASTDRCTFETSLSKATELEARPNDFSSLGSSALLDPEL
jgi:hypothetical protein